MDLFHYSRYQFARSAEFAAAEELATAHHFLAGWLQHHAYLAADQELRPELRLTCVKNMVISMLEYRV